jgi:hypothetical protein
MRKVYSSPNAAIARHVANVLEDEGIDAVVFGEHLSSAVGGVPPVEAWAEVWVSDESRVAEAQAIVRQVVTPAPMGPSWRCAYCGEWVEAQFGACWQCGAARPPDG